MQADLTPPTFARGSVGSGVWQQQFKLLLDSSDAPSQLAPFLNTTTQESV